MASKQETSGGYMDNVRVKISEKYKPPPRINLPMSYAQRLTLNKQIQDTIPQYEFLLEKTVIEKMKEWRTARSQMFQQLNERLETAKSEHLKKLESQLEYTKSDKEETQIEVTYLDPGPSQAYQQNHSILVPTQATILTPIPLKQQLHQNHDHKSPAKSPFNISDFEEDTYSPFDNMELKSINDMEELAQVLKSGNKSKSDYNFTQQNNASTPYSAMGASNYAYNTIPSSTNYVHPATSLYSTSNGYYYPPETIQSHPSLYSYPSQLSKSYSSSPQDSVIIPNIMKTLQTELDNTHLDNIRRNNIKEPVRNRSNEVFNKVKTKDEEEFNSLPKHIQDMSKSISSMGFPLLRVARVCRVIGNDQKKVVEHLLAMSDLLDLGFSEKSVSSALLQCDNDRDKALDILIS